MPNQCGSKMKPSSRRLNSEKPLMNLWRLAEALNTCSIMIKYLSIVIFVRPSALKILDRQKRASSSGFRSLAYRRTLMPVTIGSSLLICRRLIYAGAE